MPWPRIGHSSQSGGRLADRQGRGVSERVRAPWCAAHRGTSLTPWTLPHRRTRTDVGQRGAFAPAMATRSWPAGCRLPPRCRRHDCCGIEIPRLAEEVVRFTRTAASWIGSGSATTTLLLRPAARRPHLHRPGRASAVGRCPSVRRAHPSDGQARLAHVPCAPRHGAESREGCEPARAGRWANGRLIPRHGRPSVSGPPRRFVLHLGWPPAGSRVT